jgi:hypothetical protein
MPTAFAITPSHDNGGTIPLHTFGGNGYRLMFGEMQMSSAYPTGGEDISDLDDWFKEIKGFYACPTGGYQFEWDSTNKKVKVLSVAAHTHAVALDTGATAATAASSHVTQWNSHTLVDIKGAISTDSANEDAEAEPTNGHAVGAFAAVAAGAWAHGALTQPDVGRCVGIVIANDSGGALNLFEGAMKFTVTGTYKGAAQTDEITITSTGANKEVATGKYRYKFGVKPFDTITDCTLDNKPDDGLKIGIGLCSRVGLPNAIAAVADVTKCTVNSANYVLTDKVSVTNGTVDLGTIADNTDVSIVYKGIVAAKSDHTHGPGTLADAASGGATAAAAEVANGTDLGALTAVEFIAWGIR